MSSPDMDVEMTPAISATESLVMKLIDDLNDISIDTQREAAVQLRLFTRVNMDNCVLISNCGAVNPLVKLLHSTDPRVQEHAVTTLLNLSINDNNNNKNKSTITNADVFESLVYVLKTGNSEARENSAATLFTLSKIEENRIKIGKSGAITPLVALLKNGTPLGKKDALIALLNLSTNSKNKAMIVKAKVVEPLLKLMDPGCGVADRTTIALLANLATIQEGRAAIAEARGISVLVETVELGSDKGKEFAVSALCHLCLNSNRFCNMLIKEDAIPPLMSLLHSGTPRAKEKVYKILKHLKIYEHK